MIISTVPAKCCSKLVETPISEFALVLDPPPTEKKSDVF